MRMIGLYQTLIPDRVIKRSHNKHSTNDKENEAANVRRPIEYKRIQLLDSYCPLYNKSTRVAESQET